MKYIFAVIMTILGFTTLLAQPDPPDARRERLRVHREEMLERLNLTDEQEQEMQKLHIQLERKRAEIESKARLARLDLKETLMSENPDRASIEKQIRTNHDYGLQMKLAMVEHLYNVKAILSAEQVQAWKKMMRRHLLDEGRAQRMRGFQHHMRRGDPEDDE